LFGLDPATDPALREWDHGTWTGRTLDEINVTDPAGVAAWLTDPTSTPGGGESLAMVLGRVGAWLDGTAFPVGRIAIFTHPAIVRAAVIHALRAEAHSFWRVDVAPLSRTTLSGGPAGWTVNEIARAV
jgi:broad specificity phosphatase PhoE